ncbi:MAG: sarcosine oxidase subunit alpha family protein [Pseudomonadota bacterium]
MRLPGGGLIDRTAPVGFSFDGRSYRGFKGDTLASALIANDVEIVGRSFKYHRPRGIFTAGSHEPNALVTIGRGSGQEPNARATMVELHEGLQAFGQNAWPNLEFDLLAVNDLVSRFLGAGFYYKTFMWPEKFWEKLYEPLIRRAAGLGRLSPEDTAIKYEKAYAFCDLLVIGGGPAGLMAAWVAAQAGADVVLADEDTRLGGQLNGESYEVGGRPAPDWAADMVARLAEMENVRLMPRTAVTGSYDQGTYGALERLAPDVAAREGAPMACFWRIVAKRAILATGALERPVAFQNNDKPGVMLSGAMRAYANRWRVAPARQIAVFCNNLDGHRTAADLQAAGLKVTALVDARPDAKTDLDVPFFAGARVSGVRGGGQVEAITIQGVGFEEKFQTEALAVSGGWNPSVHLSSHMGARPQWDGAISAFLPAPDAIPGMQACGAANGIFSTYAVLKSGAEAAVSALQDLGLKAPDYDVAAAEDSAYDIEPLWVVEGKGRAWLDFQNDVTVKDVRQSAQENFRSVEHMKRYTTQGMAPDQGKNSNINALAVLAGATGESIPDTGTTTYRPPFVPVPIGAMGAGGSGTGFAPQRHTTSHHASLKRKAPMIEAGFWYRPSYFPAKGETTWRQSCDREVTMVRENLGVCDVSTLGKIDVQGPDAAAFLDFLYTSKMSTLKLGRVRYGLMLREDGFVMDDGTCARLGEQHYLVTTTTAAAGQVMRHFEFAHQCLRPDWDVRFVSATEQWAQFAIAGPKSLELIGDFLGASFDIANWPFMSCGAVSIGDVSARLFRISFSGEMGWELAVPARFGSALFDALVEGAEALGGGPYGMEALNVLRIEKGFITHAEIDGRVTMHDLGMSGMMSPSKDFIGKAMAARPGLVDPQRGQLIGLKAEGSVKQLIAGSHLFAPGAEPVRENSQGYISSVGYSPTLGRMVGLGFLQNGLQRHGEKVRMIEHLSGVSATCEVVPPIQFDPEGGRMRD